MPIKVLAPKSLNITDPVEITDLSGKKAIGVLRSEHNGGYTFDIYVGGEEKELFIPYADYDEFNIREAENCVGLDDWEKFETLKERFLFNDSDKHNVRLLGFCESLDKSEEVVCDRVFFQIHDKYVELSVLYIDRFRNYLFIKEGYSPYDFEFYEDDRYELYRPYNQKNPNKLSLAIVPQDITSDIFIENDEVYDCIEYPEIADLESRGELLGISYEGVDLVLDNEIFIGRFYFNYKSFKTVTKEKFLETAFNIKQIENNEQER